MANLTDAEKRALVSVVLGEARGEGPQGMATVAQVIKNRTESGKYPTSPVAVVKQSGQFTAYDPSNPMYGYKPGDAVYDNALNAINGVFGGSIPDTTGKALQYHDTSVNPGWSAPYGTKRVGNLVVYPQNASSGDTPVPATRNSLLENYVKSGDYMVDPNTAIGGPPTKRSVTTIPIKGDTGPSITNDALQNYIDSGRYSPTKAPAASNWWDGYTPAPGVSTPDRNFAADNIPGPSLTDSSLQDYISSGRYASSGQAPVNNNSAWAKLLGPDTTYRPPTLLGNGNGGAFNTGGGIAGTTQMPAGVRPTSVNTIPSYDNPKPASGSFANNSSWSDLVSSFNSPTPDPVYRPSIGYVDNKDTSRLSSSASGLPANYGTSSNAPTQPATISKQVTNPAYTKWASLSGADDPYQNAAFAYAMQNDTPAPPRTITISTPNPAYKPPVYTRPPLATSAGFGLSDPNSPLTGIANWFGNTPLGHVSSFLQGQQPLGKPGLLGGLTGMMGGINSTPTTEAQRNFYNSPTPRSLTEGGFNG